MRPLAERIVRRRLSARGLRWAQVDDLVQTVLFEVIQGLEGLPATAGPDDLVRRLSRTADLRVKDALRNHRHLVGESEVDLAQEPCDDGDSSGPITAADRRRWLEELVARLPETHAEVVRLCAFENLTCAEAGARLGLEPDTVRKRYNAAREALARRLGSDEGV